MISHSSSEIEQFLREARENHAWPLTSDLVSSVHLMSALRPYMRASQTMINEALDHICGRNDLSECRIRPRVKSIDGKEVRVRLRAIRNAEKWIDAPSRALLKEYKMPVPPQAGENEGGYVSLVHGNEDVVEPNTQQGPSF